MRTDRRHDAAFLGSERWTFDRGLGGEVVHARENPEGAPTRWTAWSHSGNERNRCFLNLGDGSFADVSGVSGADSIGDGRAFVVWDPDRDGRVDIALVNANRPGLQMFANRTPDPPAGGGGFVAVRVAGSNHRPEPRPGSSSRDAIGAVVTVDTGETTLLRALSAGEGFASQNSKTLVIGIGGAAEVVSVAVRFPSGKTVVTERVAAGTLLTIDEADATAARSDYQNR